MRSRTDISIVVALCAMVTACDSPNAPTVSYAGQWSGTTAQGKSIAFTISSAEVVTNITLDHNFNGCSGSQTWTNLNLDIAPNLVCIPGPCSPNMTSYRAFGYSSGDPIAGPWTQISGLFLSTTRVEGSVVFRNYPVCGTATGVAWSGSRR